MLVQVNRLFYNFILWVNSLVLKSLNNLIGSKMHRNSLTNISTLIPMYQNSIFFNKCYISMINIKKLPAPLQTYTRRKGRKSIQKITDKEKKVNYNIIADNLSIFRDKINSWKLKSIADGAENLILTHSFILRLKSILTKCKKINLITLKRSL